MLILIFCISTAHRHFQYKKTSFQIHTLFVGDKVISLKASATEMQLLLLISLLSSHSIPWQQPGESSNRRPHGPKREHPHQPSLPLCIRTALSKLISISSFDGTFIQARKPYDALLLRASAFTWVCVIPA